MFFVARSRYATKTRRSPESNLSFAAPSTSHEVSSSPLTVVANTTQQTNLQANGAGNTSPEYQKPPTPYEDKVIPTLRHRNRGDGGNLQGTLVTTNDVNKRNNEDMESMSMLMNTATNNDATAELNQAEMIEANQMMIVFDKNLVENFQSY